MSKFVDNIAAGVDALGLENTPIIWQLAKVQWETPQERDQFLEQIKAYTPQTQGGSASGTAPA